MKRNIVIQVELGTYDRLSSVLEELLDTLQRGGTNYLDQKIEAIKYTDDGYSQSITNRSAWSGVREHVRQEAYARVLEKLEKE